MDVAGWDGGTPRSEGFRKMRKTDTVYRRVAIYTYDFFFLSTKTVNTDIEYKTIASIMLKFNLY